MEDTKDPMKQIAAMSVGPFNVGRVDHPRAYHDMRMVSMFGATVTAWSPNDDERGPATEVHILLWNPDNNAQAVFRMNSAERVDQVIAALKDMRDRVWGPGGER